MLFNITFIFIDGFLDTLIYTGPTEHVISELIDQRIIGS